MGLSAMQGKLAATAVNAPMVPVEVLAKLQPFVSLAQGYLQAAAAWLGVWNGQVAEPEIMNNCRASWQRPR